MEESITIEEALITEWTTAVEALDSENIRELFDIRPELLWTPLTPLSHLETDFAHFIQRLEEHKLLGTSIRPVYALHHILYDYGVPNDEWAAERIELVDFILKNTKGNELNTCFWGSEQNSVMHLAYFTNQLELIQQLKSHGALTDIPNKSGHLPTIEEQSSNNNSQPEVKLLINKSKPNGGAQKDRPQNNASDRFKRLRELAESPNAANNNKPLSERQNSTRRYFRPGHLEERKRRVLSEEEEAELKKQDLKRQKEVELLAQRSAVRNNPLFKKFEEQTQQQQQAKRAPSISAASAVRERKKLLGAAEQIRRSSRVINSLKDRSYVSTSVFRQAQEADSATKKVKGPTLAQLRSGTSLNKEVSPQTSDNEDEAGKQQKLVVPSVIEESIKEEDTNKEIIKLNDENNDGVTVNNSNVTSSNVSDRLLEDDDKLTSNIKNNSIKSSNLDTKSNNINVGVTEDELESLSVGKISDRGFSPQLKKSDKKKVELPSSKVKDIVNVHEHLNDEEEIEIYSSGKKFTVWKKDEVERNENEDGVTSNNKKATAEKPSSAKVDDLVKSSAPSLSSEKESAPKEKTIIDDCSTTKSNQSNSKKEPLTASQDLSSDADQQHRFDDDDHKRSTKKDTHSGLTTNNAQSISTPTNDQTSASTTTNKVLATAKKLESPTEENFSTSKNGKPINTSTSVSNLKSVFKDEDESITHEFHTSKSSTSTFSEKKDKVVDLSTTSTSPTKQQDISAQTASTNKEAVGNIEKSKHEALENTIKKKSISSSTINSVKSSSSTPVTGKLSDAALSSFNNSSKFEEDYVSKSPSAYSDKESTTFTVDRNINSTDKSDKQSSTDVDKQEYNPTSSIYNSYSNILASFGNEDSAETAKEQLNQSSAMTKQQLFNSDVQLNINKEESSSYKNEASRSYNSTKDNENTTSSSYSKLSSSLDGHHAINNIDMNKGKLQSHTIIVAENETSPIPTATNRSESNHDYLTADKSIKKDATHTETERKLNGFTTSSGSNTVPEFSFTDDNYVDYNNNANSVSANQSMLETTREALSTSTSSSSIYTNATSSSDNNYLSTSTNTLNEREEEAANHVLHLEINTNKSQMIIEEDEESDEDGESTPTMANPHTYQQQQTQQVVEHDSSSDEEDEETRHEWKAAYDTLLSNQQEMDFEDDVLTQHNKTMANNNNNNRGDNSRQSVSSEMDETSIIQALSYQNEARADNWASKQDQAKKRQSGSQRNHWSTGIQHVDALKRESLASKGGESVATSEAGSEQWFDPDDDWNSQQEEIRRQSLMNAGSVNHSAQQPDDYSTTDYYYNQRHEEETYRHSDSSMNTNSETYSYKNSNSTENTNLDEDEEDERKHYRQEILEEEDDDYYSTNLHAQSAHNNYQNITKARGESSYYNGGQSDNDQDEEGEIVVFMNQFSPPGGEDSNKMMPLCGREMQKSVSSQGSASADITTSFFNNSSSRLVHQQQNQAPKPLTATTTTNFSSSTLSVNNIRSREDDEISLIKVPSRTIAIAEAGTQQEFVPHDPNNPRVEDISHYMNKLPEFERNANGEAGGLRGESAFDMAAVKGGAGLENESVVIKRAISTTQPDGQPVELNRGIPNAHEIDSAFLMAEKRQQLHSSNEELNKISMSSSMEANAFGKMYIGVSGAHNMLLPLPKEITYVRCVISDGEYEYMSRYEILGHQILMDYECVIDTRPGMIITVSLHVRPDYHVKPRTGWTKWFTSIRKQKEHLSGYVHPEDGAIGQTRFAVDHMVPGCYKKTYEANFDCFNSWYARTTRERARREQFGDEEDFLKIVGKLNVEMLYLPVSNPSVQVPRSLRECDLTLKIRQWHDTCWQKGFLSTRRQGTKIWERHYYRLIGSQLIGYTSEGADRQVWDHYNISDVIRLSAAADKVIVTLMESDQNDDKVFGQESIHAENHKGFFRLAFPDYHLDCVSDDLEESEEWVKTLKSMIGRVPLRLPFTD